MARRKEAVDYDRYDQNIEDCDMGPYIKEIVTRYGVNVSVFRACSSVLDGLVPGKRRMLYTFYLRGKTDQSDYAKASSLLGPVADLHPHGDLSITKTFTNEIKEWETNAPLIDCWGNSGSVTGSTCAAVRYLEARLSTYAMKCFFEEFDDSIIDMVESNTRSMLEPVVLPSRYPNFLVSSVMGIGWGNAISIVPFNLKESFELTIALIKNPDLTDVWLYPDSPRGYDIIETSDIVDICNTGKGSLTIQARMVYHEEGNERYIEVFGFPEKTLMDNIMEKITKMILEKKIQGIATLRDQSDIGDARFHIVLKPEGDPGYIIDFLYRKTPLRSHADINFNFAGRTSMQHMGLKDSLLFWISFRIDMKQRYYNKRLSKIMKRIHEIEGILYALEPERRMKTIKIVSESKNQEECTKTLMETYGLTSYQADYLADMKVRTMMQDKQQKLLEEIDNLRNEHIEIEEIVRSEDKIREKMIEELREGIKLFGKPRACQIVKPDVLESPKHYFTIVITKKVVKKLSANVQKAGLMDPDDDVIGMHREVSDDRKLYIIDNLGKCYSISLTKIPPVDAVTKGTDLKELVGLKGIPIKTFIGTNDKDVLNELVMFMFTQTGIIKASLLSQYVTNRTESSGIILNEGDALCFASIQNINTEGYVLIYTNDGMALSMDLNNIPLTERMTKGSNFLKMEDSQYVQGVSEVTSNRLLVVTNKGYCKICGYDEILQTSKRRAAMTRITGLNEDDSVFCVKFLPTTEEFTKCTCLLKSGEKIEVSMNDIPKTTRVSKGTKLIPVRRGDSIIKLKLG